MAHAKLSPSASATWMTCPGSVHLPADIGSDRSSEYAAKGTSIHALSERCLKTTTDPIEWVGHMFEGYKIDQDMAAVAKVYVDFVRELSGFKIYESKVTLEEVIDDCWGTADCVVLRPGHLSVIDLKTGAGNRVEAENNTQLLCYALGAFLKFDALYDFQTITLAVVQPPLENISTWTIEREDLLQFAETLKQAKWRIDNEPETYVLSEKGCRWCRSKTSCPEQRRLANEAAALDFKAAVDDLSEYMDKVSHLRAFCDAVENAVKEKLLQGGYVPGWKVVEGRRSRSWKDEAMVESALRGMGLTDIYTAPKLLSVAQMEKALKREGVDLEIFIEVKTGQPTLVREDDSRKSLNKAQQAAKDFAN